MRKKWEGKLLLWLPLLFGVIGIIVVAFWGQETYRRTAFFHLSTYCERLMEQDEGAEESMLAAFKEYSTGTNQEIRENDFLNQYGYRIEAFDTGVDWKIWILAGACILLFSASFLYLLYIQKRKAQKRITELTEYLEKINIGTGEMFVTETEDDFAKLQDEMYKTVTMLYETREAALKEKKNFAENLANIAHQLKTPITSASLSLQLVSKEVFDPHLDQIKRQLNRLNTLEEALLTLSRIDAGVLKLEQGEVDVYTVLSLAAENLEELLEREKVRVWIPEKEQAVFTGDLEWSMEGIMNILKNCGEHSPRGGTIFCDYSSNPLYVQIQIKDQGRGFSKEELSNLFERFYRGEETVGAGIGIGLSLTRSIFELQNGTVTARNLPDGGACFEIRIYSH